MSATRVVRVTVAAMAMLLTSSCSHFIVLRDALSASEHNDLGVVYEANGQMALAAAEYRKSLRLDPHQSAAWINRGNLEAAGAHWRAAERSFRRALQESPADPDATNNLAVALLRQGRVRDARACALRAVASGGERDSIYRDTLAEIERAGVGRAE